MRNLIAFCTAVLLMASIAAAQAQSWTIEEVDAGTKPELALDSAGHVHIAYMTEALNGSVSYATKAAGDWTIETVAEGYFYGPLDLAIDEDDGLHIVYHDHQDMGFDASLGDAAYAFKRGGNWQVETISDPGHDGWDPSIALGPDGAVYVASIDPVQFGSEDGVEWAVRSESGTWSVSPLGSGPVPYEFGTQVVVDTGGRAHIVYHDGSERLNGGSGSDLYYAVQNGGNWDIQVVDEDGDVGKFASLALDAMGNPHIAYFEWNSLSTGYVKYARWSEGEWLLERIEALDDVEISFLGARRMVSLVLDAQDRPHVAYSDRSSVRYAVQSANGWDMQTAALALTGNVLGQLVSLALDVSGRPHIAYYELSSGASTSLGAVFYAVGQTPTAVEETAVQPVDFVLRGNYPNPFNASTILHYTLANEAAVELGIYNVLGQRLRTLVEGRMGAGEYRVAWDGLDAAGQNAASGIYLARLQSGESEAVQKMLLLR